MSLPTITESPNPDSANIDRMSSLEIVRLINQNDRVVASAVEAVLPAIAEAIDLIAEALRAGGRLFYVGAGTSGRLGVVDAAECPPTFGTEPDRVQALIAGGQRAMFLAREGEEDNAEQGGADLLARGLASGDVVVGLSTSGRTPYTRGALEAARKVGAHTVAVICNPTGPIARHADVLINPVTGPEVIMGSTRMKAGTAQKMVLNMLSTGAMVRIGRVSGNRMADMNVSCEKLRVRAARMISMETGVSEEEAVRALDEANGSVRGAIDTLRSR